MSAPRSITYFITEGNEYTKEELYEAFLDVTERLLNEMISNINYENVIDILGSDEAEELIEEEAERTTMCYMSEGREFIHTKEDEIRYLIDVLDRMRDDQE